MDKKSLPIFKISFFNKCPSCLKGGIYASLLKVKDKCDICGFALKENDAGDGPAFFAMFIVGIFVTAMAGLVEVIYPIPILLHMVIWTPLIIGLSIYLLMIIKSFLIAMQYKHNVLGFGEKKKK